MDYQQATDWKALEIQPFNLADVPSGLEWCIYPEELERGEVLCPKSVYMIVLALRFLLSYTDSGLYDDFETWKVYWKSEGKYGFVNHIYLAKDKVEGYGYDDEFQELQAQTWITLATLRCGNGKGNIDRVTLDGSQPYGGKWTLDGTRGVQRLLEDAIHGSRALSHHIERRGNQTTAYRLAQDYVYLGFTPVKGEFDHIVADVELKTWRSDGY
jgi:hypothetical protein